MSFFYFHPPGHQRGATVRGLAGVVQFFNPLYKRNHMKFTLGLLLGATVGAAVVHYLNTSEGKALVDKVKEDVDDVSCSISGIADDIVSKGKSLLGKTEETMDEAVENIVVIV
jgi:gas vesicle protein